MENSGPSENPAPSPENLREMHPELEKTERVSDSLYTLVREYASMIKLFGKEDAQYYVDSQYEQELFDLACRYLGDKPETDE